MSMHHLRSRKYIDGESITWKSFEAAVRVIPATDDKDGQQKDIDVQKELSTNSSVLKIYDQAFRDGCFVLFMEKTNGN